MVAGQSVVQEHDGGGGGGGGGMAYCSPIHSPYQGEYYPEYFVAGAAPPEMCPAHHMCTVHGDFGPVTVPMVSTNSSPPIAMPVQVPPGHVVQQIVDENGTLRHVILSPQHPASLVLPPSHNPPHYGAGPANGTTQGAQTYYQGLPPNFPPPHFHSNIPPGHPSHVPSPTHPGHSPPPNHGYYKDERAQRQYFKLKKKLHDKQQKGDSLSSPRKDLVNGLRRGKEKGMNSVGTSEDGEESSSVQDEEDSVQIITDMLSSVQAPKVSELSSRSALLQWAPPLRLSEASSNDSHELDVSESDLRYEVLLSDRSKEMKFKSIYSGTSLSCRIQDLRPGQEYSVCLQVHLEELQGSASDLVKFVTPPCEPDQPQPPKLISRTKNTLQLRWNTVNDNGSHISYYILEYDDGKGGDFVELHKSRGRQHTLQKLQPATMYKFRLAAMNEIGKSLYSDVVTYWTSDNPPLQPNPPVLKEASTSSLHLLWQKRPKDDDFLLQMNDPKTDYGYMVVYNDKDTQYVCGNLKHFTEYRFRLRAQNEGGVSPWSEEVLFRTLPDRPARPSKPVVKGRIHAHSFRLKWEPPTYTGGADINEYILEVNSGSGYEVVYCGGDTEAVCDKLTPGTTYQLRVSCISAGGRSNYSDPCTVTTDAISPGQCATPCLHGKPKAHSITIRWQGPDYNGGAPVLEYEVEMVSGLDSSRSLVHKSKELECTVPNLNPGGKYSFQVRAVNRIGPGPWSETFTATSGAAPPDPPAAPCATCKSPFHVYVEWAEPRANGAPVTEYKLEISPSEIDDQFTSVYQGSSCSHDVRGLTPFTAYYFRVQAFNSAGASQFSPITTTKTSAAPPGVVAITSYETTPTSIALFWSEPPNNGSTITHYTIEIGDKVLVTEGAVNEYTINDLAPDTSYKIKIQAVNAIGCGSLSPTLRASTLRLPPPPPKLECIATAHNYLKLKWGEGKNTDYTQYCVMMENQRTQELQCVFKGTAFTCKVNKLQELTTYKFKICASNDAGEGEFSDEYAFTTTFAPPTGIKAPHVVEVEQRGCTLEWTPARNTTTDAVIYMVQVCRLKDQIYKQIYKGSETRCVVENLEPAAEYNAKVCPIRLTSAGELPGPFSPHVHFATLASEPSSTSKLSSSNSSSPTHSHRSHNVLNSLRMYLKHPRSISDQQWVFIMAVCIVMVGIILAVIIMRCINPK